MSIVIVDKRDTYITCEELRAVEREYKIRFAHGVPPMTLEQFIRLQRIHNRKVAYGKGMA